MIATAPAPIVPAPAVAPSPTRTVPPVDERAAGEVVPPVFAIVSVPVPVFDSEEARDRAASAERVTERAVAHRNTDAAKAPW